MKRNTFSFVTWKKAIIFYHQLPRRCILMIKKDKCHVEVKKQCRKVSKILSLEPQALFLIILYFCVLRYLKPLSRLLKTICITPILAKNRVGDTTTPLSFQLPNSPVCSLCKPVSFHSLPQSSCTSSKRTDPPYFPSQSKTHPERYNFEPRRTHANN